MIHSTLHTQALGAASVGAGGFAGLSMQAAAQRAASLAAALSGNPAGAAKPHYEAELEINDFPQHARWKVDFFCSLSPPDLAVCSTSSPH